MNDPYRTLGVSPTVTQAEIKAAYRRLARKWHPDLHQQDPKASRRFREINEAYRELSQPGRRRAYVQPVPDDAPFWQAGSGSTHAPGENVFRASGPASARPGAGFGAPRPAPAHAGVGAGAQAAARPHDPLDDLASDILHDIDDIGQFLSDIFRLDDIESPRG